MIDNKSKFLIDKFKITEELLCQILDISESIGTTKYNVWLAKESKKNPDILNLDKIRYIVDWAQIEKPDILSLDFDNAFSRSEEWHKELKQNFKNISKQNLSESRIVYRCSDKEHFFIKLIQDSFNSNTTLAIQMYTF
jgi:Txe/YoeB family toxin of Txe-Axe toxin-antitoxin module